MRCRRCVLHVRGRECTNTALYSGKVSRWSRLLVQYLSECAILAGWGVTVVDKGAKWVELLGLLCCIANRSSLNVSQRVPFAGRATYTRFYRAIPLSRSGKGSSIVARLECSSRGACGGPAAPVAASCAGASEVGSASQEPLPLLMLGQLLQQSKPTSMPLLRWL